MSGFCPHTSKTGGLRNITHKKCKPKDIGTMTRNGVEAITGIFTYHNIVEYQTA